MAENVAFQVGTVSGESQHERRGKFRIGGPIPASVSGISEDGLRLDVEATLDNLSAGGLYVRLDRPVARARELSFEIRLPVAPGRQESGMRFAASGLVRRVEACAEGKWGLGVEFTGYRER